MANTATMTKIDTEPRRYLLSPVYAFRGWKKLPYALQYLYREQTEHSHL